MPSLSASVITLWVFYLKLQLYYVDWEQHMSVMMSDGKLKNLSSANKYLIIMQCLYKKLLSLQVALFIWLSKTSANTWKRNMEEK